MFVKLQMTFFFTNISKFTDDGVVCKFQYENVCKSSSVTMYKM